MSVINSNINDINNNLSCDVIKTLQDYTLNEENIEKALGYKLETQKKHKSEITCAKDNVNLKKKNDFFIPLQKDTLFWCFYIIKNGDIKYELLGKITPIIEKKLKIDYVEKIRKEKQLIKPYKFFSLTNIENQLANEFTIDLKTFLSLCVVENINVFCIHKRTYYELLMNDSTDIFIINVFDNKTFGFKLLRVEDSELKNYKTSLFKIDNIEKPTKSITSYKVCELVDYCNKLLIDVVNKETGKTKSKKDLYESFVQYF